MHSNQLNWAKSFGSAGGYYDKINEMITNNKLMGTSASTSNVIKHAASLPANTPTTTNFENNLFMLNNNQNN
jgi:hypothetical protein